MPHTARITACTPTLVKLPPLNCCLLVPQSLTSFWCPSACHRSVELTSILWRPASRSTISTTGTSCWSKNFCQMSRCQSFMFQQDSVPAYRAHETETVDLLTKETPAFILPMLWIPNSLNLNLVGYEVWLAVQKKRKSTRNGTRTLMNLFRACWLHSLINTLLIW